MSYKALGYNFYTRPIKYTRYFAREYPSYFWSLVIGLGAPAGFAAYPYVRERLGLDNSRPDFPPLNYPIPNRPRKPLRGFEDPPPGVSSSFSTVAWYRHPPPDYVRVAIEKQGLSWDAVLKDLEQRRDAMVEGDEWDIKFKEGKIVWDKPDEEKMMSRFQSQVDFRQWGEGWRKGVLWMVWKVLGSPEGVFEYEGGKKDGKLVLRDLSKSPVTPKSQKPQETEEKKGKDEKAEKA